jgi:hypothetical protein
VHAPLGTAALKRRLRRKLKHKARAFQEKLPRSSQAVQEPPKCCVGTCSSIGDS